MVVKAEGSRRWVHQEVGVRRCKLFYVEWLNKVLMYSIVNCIQYSVMNHNGKEYEKECVFIYICVCVCVCVYNYITLLYRSNRHIVNQLYINKIKFWRKKKTSQTSKTLVRELLVEGLAGKSIGLWCQILSFEKPNDPNGCDLAAWTPPFVLCKWA